MPGDGKEQVSETCTVITTLLDHRGRARRSSPGRLSHQVERIGDHLRRGQGHHRRRREPHQRPGPALRLAAPGHPGSLGLAHRHPSSPAPARPPRSAASTPAARALRRKDAAPVTADEESFTAVRHHAIRSMTTSQVTATSSLDALAAAADAAARAALHTLNVPGRQRHSVARAESTPEIPPRHRDQAHRYWETPGHRVRTRILLSHPARTPPPGRRSRPPGQDRGPWNRAPAPPRHAGEKLCPDTKRETDSRAPIEHHDHKAPGSTKHLKSVVLTSRGLSTDAGRARGRPIRMPPCHPDRPNR